MDENQRCATCRHWRKDDAIIPAEWGGLANKLLEGNPLLTGQTVKQKPWQAAVITTAY